MKRAKDKKKDEEELFVIARCTECLNAGEMIKDQPWTPREIEHLNKHLFLTSKPVIFLVNIGDTQYVKKQNVWLPKI